MKQITLDILLAEKIKDYIATNALTQNQRIPSDRDLALMFGVQRLTVRSALKRLENEGILYSVPRSGFYVAEKKLIRDLVRFESLTEMMRDKGLQMTTRCIRINLIECNKKISQFLQIPLGTKLYSIQRIRFVEGKPFTLETSYLPEHSVRGIENYDLENQSLYQVLKDSFDIHLCGATQEISMVFARDEDAQLLGVEAGEALLLLRSVAVDKQGNRMEYSESMTRGDRCIFTNVLTRKET